MALDPGLQMLLNLTSEDIPELDNSKSYVRKVKEVMDNLKLDPTSSSSLNTLLMTDRAAMSEDGQFILSAVNEEHFNSMLNQIAMIPDDAFIEEELGVFLKAMVIANLLQVFKVYFTFTE